MSHRSSNRWVLDREYESTMTKSVMNDRSFRGQEAVLMCPCGAGRPLDDCCGAIIAGAAAPTAEALMRSRYTAFVVGNIDHIAATHAQAGPDPFDRAHAASIVAEVEWRGLEILAVSAGGAEDETGRVAFKARFRRLGQELVHHEAARFVKEQGRWVYLDGEINPKGTPRRVVSVGRNDPCPCGSGRKAKKCCGA
jgi:SEC-C motif domain protein